MSRTLPPPQHSIRLTRKRIYIIPSRHGLLFGFILGLMLLGSMNYNNSMGFVLTFLLASMALVSILHTYRNLAGLQFSAGQTEAVFAGETLHFSLWADNREQQARHALSFTLQRDAPPPAQVFDLPADQRVCLHLPLPTRQRGQYPLGRILLETHFPLGLFRAWTYLHLDGEALVYPRPSGQKQLPPGSPDEQGEERQLGDSGDDFVGYRAYRLGDSPRHVDWKAAARERGYLVKQFGGEAGQALLWLDWRQVSHLRDPEAALGQLCQWVLSADTQYASYGLRLPGMEIEPGQGHAHKHACLESLALFVLD